MAVSVVALAFGCFLFVGKGNSVDAKGSASVGGTTIAGTGTGAIPDRGAAGCGLPAGPDLDISFDASGVSGDISNVSVDMDASHTWVGDLEASLIAPDGTEHILYSSTGSTTATGCGSGDDLGGVYEFDNSGTDDWWALGNPYPAGTYQTTSAGDVPGGGAATDMNAAFAGVNPTGTWTLRVNDSGGGDTGSISAANLTITTGGVAAPGPVDMDFDGDGTADAVITRDNTPLLTDRRHSPDSLSKGFEIATARANGARREQIDSLKNASAGGPVPGTNRQWWVSNSSDGSFDTGNFGSQEAGEQIAPADYDGDGKLDFAVWRGVGTGAPSGNGFFFILNSSDNSVSTIDFGQTGDEAGIVGDYDGDGMADPAVFRQPGSAPFGQTTFFYQGSAGGGEITFVPFGDNTTEDIRAIRGDFDGDGMMDFTIHRTSPTTAGKGQFVTLRSSDGGVDYVDFGNNSDLLFPGDFDGDGQADYMIARIVSNNIHWWLLDSNGNVTFNQFGIIGIAGFSEFAAPADYDGDGADDIAIYRRNNADSEDCWFYVLRSSDGALQTMEWGGTSDVPAAVWDQQF